MKRIALVCLSLAVLSTGIGCCGFPGYGGGYQGGYQPYSPGCPGGNCNLGYQGAAPTAYAPAAISATAPIGAPVAVAPGYYQPYSTAAVNHLPTY
jgi:hypothetical protein